MKRYKYVGKERDEETGLYYYGARYYSAWLGRFVSVDPLAGKYLNLNPYCYVGNNPINMIDPDGKKIVPWIKYYDFKVVEFGPYYSGLTNIQNSDKKFHKAYTEMAVSSSVFREAVGRLEMSNRFYEFNTFLLTDRLSIENRKKNEKFDRTGAYFSPSHKGTENDPYPISFKVDMRRGKEQTFSGRKATIFEEVFHA